MQEADIQICNEIAAPADGTQHLFATLEAMYAGTHPYCPATSTGRTAEGTALVTVDWDGTPEQWYDMPKFLWDVIGIQYHKHSLCRSRMLIIYMAY